MKKVDHWVTKKSRAKRKTRVRAEKVRRGKKVRRKKMKLGLEEPRKRNNEE